MYTVLGYRGSGKTRMLMDLALSRGLNVLMANESVIEHTIHDFCKRYFLNKATSSAQYEASRRIRTPNDFYSYFGIQLLTFEDFKRCTDQFYRSKSNGRGFLIDDMENFIQMFFNHDSIAGFSLSFGNSPSDSCYLLDVSDELKKNMEIQAGIAPVQIYEQGNRKGYIGSIDGCYGIVNGRACRFASEIMVANKSNYRSGKVLRWKPKIKLTSDGTSYDHFQDISNSSSFINIWY